MRISALHIDGFGIYANQTLRDIAPGLTILQGTNEAGKSTLLAFLRAIPYGFEPRRDSPVRYEPLAGGNHGGWIEFDTRSGGVYRLLRGPGKTLPGEVGLIDLESNQGVDARELDRILGAPREAFFSVYAFTLGELQGLEPLTSDQVRARIWSAGMGHTAVPIADVEAGLRKRRDDMYSPRGSARDINQTVSRLKAARAALQDAEARRQEYERKSGELSELRAQAGALTDEVERLERRLRRLNLYLQVWDTWVRLQADRKELAACEPVEGFPPDGLTRVEELARKREDLGKELAQLGDRIVARTKRRDELLIDTRLLGNRAAVDVLAQRVSKLEAALHDLPIREEAVGTEERQLARDLRELAPGRDEEWLKGVDVSAPVTNAAREHGEQLRRAQEAVNASHEVVVRVRRTAQSAEAQRNDALQAQSKLPASSVGGPDELRRRREALARARQAMADVQSADDEQRHLQERREDLGRQMAAAEARREQAGLVLPAWPVALVGVFAGVLMVGLVRSTPGVIGGLALAGAGVGVWLWLRAVQRASGARAADDVGDDLARIGKQLADVDRRSLAAEAQLAEARKRLADCAEAVGVELHTLADVEAAAGGVEDMREQLAQRRSADEAVTVAERASATAAERLAEAEETLANAQEALEVASSRWRAWLQQRDLSPDLSPEGFSELAQGVRGLRKGLQNLDQTRSRAAGIARDIEAIAEQAAAVFAACSRPLPPQPQLPGAITGLAAEVQRSVESQVAAEGIEGDLRDLEDDLRRTEKALAQADAGLEALIRRAGAQDLEDFRHRGRTDARQRELRRSIAEYETQLEIVVGVGDERGKLEAELAELVALDGTERELAEVEAAYRESQGRLTDTKEGLVRRELEIEHLETSEEIAARLQEQTNEAARLAAQIEEYGTLTAALLLLRRARRKYEEERQPLVVRRAGECMARITGARYVDVVSPLGQPDELLLRDAEGGQKGIGQLSQGTKQQLYLAMRLAYVTVHHASPSIEPLPLVMDEVLVNFDPDRARRTAELIVDVAQRNQVLLFTCHPETLALFRQVDPEIAVVGLDNGVIHGVERTGG